MTSWVRFLSGTQIFSFLFSCHVDQFTFHISLPSSLFSYQWVTIIRQVVVLVVVHEYLSVYISHTLCIWKTLSPLKFSWSRLWFTWTLTTMGDKRVEKLCYFVAPKANSPPPLPTLSLRYYPSSKKQCCISCFWNLPLSVRHWKWGGGGSQCKPDLK